MSTTANIGLEILTEGQANKEASITLSHQILDALVQGGVKDRDLATPPGSPAEGDLYLVAASATGAWAGQDGKIAHYRNGAWSFITPRERWRIWVDDEDVFIVYDGAAWSKLGGFITVKEVDGAPAVTEVDTVRVTNGKLTDDGGGQVTIDVGGAIAGFQGIWEQIDRQEFSGASSVTVGGSQTPEDYDLYVMFIFGVVPGTDGANLSVYGSTNGGSTKITNYTRQGSFWRSAATDGDFGDESAGVIQSGAIDTSKANKAAYLRLEVLHPSSSQHKPLLVQQGWPDNAGASLLYSQIESCWIEDTGAIDSFVIEPSVGTISGTAVLLGMKQSETAGRLLEENGTSRTFGVDDNNRIIHFTNAGIGVTVTVPDSLPEGFSCRLINETGGAISVSGGGGLSLVGDISIPQSRAAEICRIRNTRASVVSL